VERRGEDGGELTSRQAFCRGVFRAVVGCRYVRPFLLLDVSTVAPLVVLSIGRPAVQPGGRVNV
jgi:hypothetical protein